MRYHLTTVRMAIIEKTENSKVSENVEKMDPLLTLSGNVN